MKCGLLQEALVSGAQMANSCYSVAERGYRDHLSIYLSVAENVAGSYIEATGSDIITHEKTICPPLMLQQQYAVRLAKQ